MADRLEEIAAVTDRLTMIEAHWDSAIYFEDLPCVIEPEDVNWLIAEVKRLREALGAKAQDFRVAADNAIQHADRESDRFYAGAVETVEVIAEALGIELTK